jgi:hypothetical protein
MGKAYRKFLGLIILMLIITTMMGISYAFYEQDIANTKKESLVYTNEKLSVNYLDGKDFDLSNILSGDTYTKRVSITNVSSNDLFVTLSLMDVEKENDTNLSLIVLDGDNNEVYNNEITNVDTEVIKTHDLASGKTLSYTLMIKNNGNNTINKFYADMLAYTESVKADAETFKSTLLKNNSIKNALTTPGKEAATTDEGLIKTIDDDGEAYYYRGKVSNNYVNFGGFTWRILRINGNGTIRLIMEDAIDDIAPYNSNTDVVDDYTSKLNFDGTDAKSKLNTFLTNNLSDVKTYIANSNFCNDTNIIKEENGVEVLNPYNRIYNDNSPSLICAGTKTQNQIGLANIDEVVMAGAYQDSTNNDYYLANPSIKNGWWTMSGSQIITANNAVDGFVVLNNGALNYEKKISMAYALRPVISLDKNTVVSGNGTSDIPYIVKVN